MLIPARWDADSVPVTGWRAITTRQPWAWATAWGGRTIGNRKPGWATFSYRGPVAIHAAVQPDVRLRGCIEVSNGRARWVGPDHSDKVPAEPWDALRRSVETARLPLALRGFAVRGAVLAVADLVDIHPAANCCLPWGENPPGSPFTVHVVVEGVRPLAIPLPARGQVGLWVPDRELADELSHASVL